MVLFKRLRANEYVPSPDFSAQRRAMVNTQLRGRGIKDERVLAAMESVPRHSFVPPRFIKRSYEDRPLAIGGRQTISQPYMVAAMTEQLDVAQGDKILEVGTGSGYQTAVLSVLAKGVVSLERNEQLAASARERLEDLGYANVRVVYGDGTLGSPNDAPFDRILVTAAAPKISPSLKSQLAVGGVLVCPVGTRKVQHLVKMVRTDTGYESSKGTACMFVPLIGEQGW